VDEGHEHQLEQTREAGGRRGDTQERRDRHRRSLVGVGGPELERDRADLEREPDHHEEDGRVRERLLRPGQLLEAGAHRRELEVSREPVDQAHPVEHHRRGQDADQEELQPALVPLDVGLPERGHQEPGGGDELESEEQHQQVAGGRHQQTAEERREEQEVVLALVEAALAEVAVRDQQHHRRGRHEERLEHDREGVHLIGPAEGRPIALPDQ
jgi:hypothetical protein